MHILYNDLSVLNQYSVKYVSSKQLVNPATSSAADGVHQESPNYSPLATSGPGCDFIRPAKELCRNAPIELIFQ
jgi:hypothetical protein